MGRSKLLLSWGKTSVLGHLVAQWKRLEARQVVVVWARGDRAIKAELDALGFPAENRICNPARERGMFSSVQCAAEWAGWAAALTHWVVVLGDQPHLREETLRKVADFARSNPGRVCQPARAGQPRHPVILPQSVFVGLRSSTAQDLREFLSGQPRAFVEIDDPGLDLDIDRPEDYQRALKLIVQQ